MSWCFKFQVSSFRLPNHAALHEERAECGSEYRDNEVDDFVDGFLFHIAVLFIKTGRKRRSDVPDGGILEVMSRHQPNVGYHGTIPESSLPPLRLVNTDHYSPEGAVASLMFMMLSGVSSKETSLIMRLATTYFCLSLPFFPIS